MSHSLRSLLTASSQVSLGRPLPLLTLPTRSSTPLRTPYSDLKLDKILPRLSSSQLKCSPGELLLLITFVVRCIIDANLMYLDCGVNYYMKVGNEPFLCLIVSW
jgi:hypothetical protein